MTFITLTRFWTSHRDNTGHTEDLFVNPSAIATIRPTKFIDRDDLGHEETVTGCEVVLKSRAAYTVIESAETVRKMAEAAGL